ncbi:inactive transglutaminase family protein [Teredinibacter turnerae]|uniref:inactive transglutaminase family protein n=1 Tax=Teredinibacter turnerae TaxID=2426 RepID=UPI000566DC8C|nr:inactive transglutaminase family protein [Teredinibacter turnerae]
MRQSRAPFYALIALLFVAGLSMTWLRHKTHDVPWLPGEKRQVWSVEARVEFEAQGEPAKVSLAVPQTQTRFERLAEYTASPGYGLAFVENGRERRAEWSIRNADGPQTLYYRLDLLVDPSLTVADTAPPLEAPSNLFDDSPHATSALHMLDSAVERSADNFTLARELILEFNLQKQSAGFLEQRQARSRWLKQLLNYAQVPAREVKVLTLEDGRRRQRLQTYLQVFQGERYQLFDPRSGRVGLSPNQVMWEYRSGSVLELIGGSQSDVSFSIINQEIPVSQGLEKEGDHFSLLEFSIHSLPVEEQALFKGILLVPVGVLVVVLMRVLVGLRTSGTFMPVLIALSFIQTSLLTGLAGFLLIVGVGLVIRSYLSHLSLLLVARISAVIISVIAMVAVFTVIAYELGLNEGMKITLFPMIILSWTIERMSILWEEEGPHEVFVQGGGSLLVALIAYLLMTNDIVRHLTFNFIGLQLVFMALVLLLGGYTGYRLLELRRFSVLGKGD